MVQKKEPAGAMVVRKKFDYGLVQLAVDSGADFIDGKRAVEFVLEEYSLKEK